MVIIKAVSPKDGKLFIMTESRPIDNPMEKSKRKILQTVSLSAIRINFFFGRNKYPANMPEAINNIISTMFFVFFLIRIRLT